MHLILYISYPVCLTLLIAATITDIKLRRNPNVLTIPLILGGLLFGCVLIPGLRVEKAVFALLCFLAGLLPGLGLGDLKLIMCIGLWGNPFLTAFEVAAASVGVLLVQLIRNPILGQIQILRGLKYPFPMKERFQKTKDNSVPFAPYFLVAYILVEGGLYLWSTL